jgi:DNA helicase-2/ATP-dependent DNA helicase PcrA
VTERLRPADLRDLLQVPFTDEQLAAASAPLEPAVIVAGAGSGKTSVMAARVVWLVATGQVAPERVLGLTFTNKAAAELAARIRTALDRSTQVLAARGSSSSTPLAADDSDGEPVVSTYHSFAGRLVTDHGLRLGIEPQSRLLADATRFQLAARVLRRHRKPIRHLTSPLRMLVGDLVALESEMSEHLVEPEQVVAHALRWHERLQDELAETTLKTRRRELERLMGVAERRVELAALVGDYRTAKRDLDAVDFGDQVALAARLAEECPEVGEIERSAAGVVLLDEYQDTSVAQRRLLAGLFGGGHPVVAVGDPCQAIYGWRGASVANLDAFPEHFPRADGSAAKAFSLSVNQRSGGRLLRLANAVAAGLRRRHRVVELCPRSGAEELGETVVALHETSADEVRWVARRIADEIAAGTAPGECAVLVRSRSDFPALYEALTAQGLPVEVVGLGGLLTLPEVADVVAVLQVLDDPTANAALVRLLTGPRMRLGPRDLAALGRRARALLRPTLPSAAGGRGSVQEQLSLEGLDEQPATTVVDPALRDDADDDSALEDAVAGIDPCDVTALSDALDDLGEPADVGLSAEAARRCRQLSAELTRLRRSVDEPLLDLLQRVITVTGLEIETEASPEAATSRRRETLAAFLDVAASFVDLDGQSSLTAFLAFLAAAEEHERGLDSTTPSGADAVQVMTVHKAKGLEWDVVAVPDLTKSVFPVTTVRSRWTSDPAVLPYMLRGDADSLPDCASAEWDSLEQFKADTHEHQRREEERLGYVAFTRPRRLLLGSGHWWGPSQKKPRGPSPFLEQLREHCVAGSGVVDCWVDQPEDGIVNPQLAEIEAVPWPAPYDDEAWQRRLAAADRVRDSMAALVTDSPMPEDDELAPVERALLAALDRDADLLIAELRRQETGMRDVELPTSISATQLLRLHADPDGLAADLARPLPHRPSPQARRGTRFHAWVEELFDQRPLLDPDDLPGAEDASEGDDADLAALQQAFLEGPYAERRPHAVEAPFALALAGRVVRGRIDAVYDLGDGRYDVIDWKTGKETADPLQLAVYRLAWAQLAGVSEESVGAAFYYVLDGRVERPELPSASTLAALLAGKD